MQVAGYKPEGSASQVMRACCGHMQVVYRESDSEDESEVEAEDAMAPVLADLNGLDSEEDSGESGDDLDDSESDDSGLEDE